MQEALIARCGFIDTNIHILTTADRTSCELIATIRKVKNQTTDASTVVILLSGHGYQTRDTTDPKSSDEADGMDEMINIGGRTLTDDAIHAEISRFMCKTILLADTCHSGTMFDLPLAGPDTVLGNLISLSACNDSQLSMCDVGDKTGFGGSLTTAVLCDGVLEKLVERKTSNDVHLVRALLQARLSKLNQQVILGSQRYNP
jgi:hypothetical protein